MTLIDFEELRSIEDHLPRDIKKSQGIYFTPLKVVEEIASHFNFNQVKRVLDSAAGCGNFLFSLALRFPHIQFYGIEKNQELFRWAQKHSQGIDNLTFFQGDLLLDTLPIPPCDLYLGNPPFVNFNDLPGDQVEAYKKLWLRHFPHDKGFRMLLGKSRGDLAQLCFYHTLTTYLAPQGEFGVVLPRSLVVGNSASAGFRRLTGIGLTKITSLPEGRNFAHTLRDSVYIIGQKGEETQWPLLFQDGKEQKYLVRTKEWGFLEEKFSSLLGDNPYQPRQGINTLGANKIFFFDTPPFRSPLIQPLLRSGDLEPFGVNPSRYVLLPYMEGRLLREEELLGDHPLVWEYLCLHKPVLEKRASRFSQNNWYSLFGIGPYTFSPYLVVWRSLGARKMISAVVESGVPNQAMFSYIGVETEREAHYLNGLLNTDFLNDIITALSPPGSKGFAQPGVLSQIFIPPYSEKSSWGQELADNSMTATCKGDSFKLKAQREALVQKLYSHR